MDCEARFRGSSLLLAALSLQVITDQALIAHDIQDNEWGWTQVEADGVTDGGKTGMGSSRTSRQWTGPIIPAVFDWHVRDEMIPNVGILPVPHPGHDWPADHPVYQSLYDTLVGLDLPLALMLRDDTGPAHGMTDPDALTTVMGYAARLDYVFADFEDEHREENVLATVDLVRTHPDPNINSARIGNYADYPGAFDPSFPYPWQSDRTDQDIFYRESGLDVAMPHAYPYEYYETHTSSYVWGDQIAPNVRSGLFWAPLERMSVALRDLPTDHLAIIWLAGFIPWDGYEAEPPTQQDREALVKHARLRGAHGYYTLASFIDGYPDDQFRLDMLAQWQSLDWLFDSAQIPCVLNLDTDKTTGLQWSGMLRGVDAVFLISNLGDDPAVVDLPDMPGLPNTSPIIEAGTHELLMYTVSAPADITGDGVVDVLDLLEVLGQWGGSGSADITGDGVVDVLDLLEVLGAWGPC